MCRKLDQQRAQAGQWDEQGDLVALTFLSSLCLSLPLQLPCLQLFLVQMLVLARLGCGAACCPSGSCLRRCHEASCMEHI
jgi:hypothetical protein